MIANWSGRRNGKRREKGSVTQNFSKKYLARTGLLAAAAMVCSSWLAPDSDAFIRRDGRNIKDPWGSNIVIRGVEMNHGWDYQIPEISKSNANYVRFLFYVENGNVGADFPAYVESCIRLAIENHMLVSIGFVGLPGATQYEKTQWGVSWLINNKAMLMKYERHLVLHGMGEAFGDVTAWRNDNLTFLQQLRNAGYKCPIDVVSTEGGRNVHTVVNNGQWLIDNDPQQNLIMGWQAYWPWNQTLTANYWQGYNGMTLSQAIDLIATKNFPIQIGNGVWDGYSGDQHYIDYKTIMTKAQQHGVGWAVWNWSGEYGTPMTNSWQGAYGDWYSVPGHPFGSDTGYQLVEGHAASIKNTSVRTSFMNNTGNGRGLKAEYFDNNNLTSPVATRVDREINNNYGSAAPNVTGMGADDFSIRWSGSVQAPVTGSYVFQTTADNAVRLWVNDQLVIDRWYAQTTTSYTATVSLQAGARYNLRMEYAHNTGNANVYLRWLTPGAFQQVVIPSIYLFDAGVNVQPTPTPTPTPNPTATPTPTPTPTPNPGSGTISREVWNNVTGTAVSSIPVSTTPSTTGTLTSMEAPTNAGDNYGQRLRGYITAPATGSYTFWIAADDDAQLWISTNDQTSGRTLIASVTGWTNSREWNKYTSQKSAARTLTQGQTYYVEVLMKEATGGDNLAVGWARPGQGTTSPSEVVPGSVLSPFNGSNTSTQYEAENATRNVGVMSDHAGFSGTGFVGGFGNVGDYVTFNVNVSGAGNRTVTLRYANGYSTASSMSVYVNGARIRQTTLPSTGSWSTWGTKAETLSLNSGNNTIMYRRDSGDVGNINIDRITVQ